MISIKLNTNESLTIVLDKYKDDLKSEIKKLKKALPKILSKSKLEKIAKDFQKRIEKEVISFLIAKHYHAFETIRSIVKDPFSVYECWEADIISLSENVQVEIPIEINFETNYDSNIAYVKFQCDMPQTEVLKKIINEIENVSKDYIIKVDEIDTLERKLQEAEQNSTPFRSKIKRQLLENTEEGKKILADLSKVNIAKALSHEAS